MGRKHKERSFRIKRTSFCSERWKENKPNRDNECGAIANKSNLRRWRAKEEDIKKEESKVLQRNWTKKAGAKPRIEIVAKGRGFQSISN